MAVVSMLGISAGSKLHPRRSVRERTFQGRPVVIIAAIAQLAARRSHNPKVVSSILTRRMLFVAKSPHVFYNF